MSRPAFGRVAPACLPPPAGAALCAQERWYRRAPLTAHPLAPICDHARRAGWLRRPWVVEESPDSLKQRCRVTPGRGNPTESATENRLPPSGAEKVKRWGKSPPRPWQQGRHGKPHREQCRIGPPRGQVPERETAARPASAERGRVGSRRRGVSRVPDEWSSTGATPEQNPAYRPSAHGLSPERAESARDSGPLRASGDRCRRVLRQTWPGCCEIREIAVDSGP